MKKIIFFVVVILTITAVGQAWVLWSQKSITPENTTTPIREIKEIIPTSAQTSYIPGSILSQSANDKEGRTVIYKNDLYLYPKTGGTYNTSVTPRRLIHMIGSFVGWEEVIGSKDRYLLSTDSLNKEKLPKIRVAFEDSKLFHGGSANTVFGVKNLTTGKVETKNRMLVKNIRAEKLDEILKLGDVVITYALFDEPKPKVQNLVYDEQGQLLASWLIIRRKDGLNS